jgi:predicted dehydrogenase
MTGKTALVIGYGSIGKRHADVLTASGFRTAVVSRRQLPISDLFPTVRVALASLSTDLVVVCNETSAHRATLAELDEAGYRGPVLVEKPLWQPGEPAFRSAKMRISVGYILRFHPVLVELKRRLATSQAFTAEVRCASYLPDWRPGADYRGTESARIEAGGGALRDLSHEIDYARWLFGDIRSVAALGGHLSDLEIETDDSFMILARAERCRALSISINYLDRTPQRSVIANVAEGTFHADLLAGTVKLNGTTLFEAPPFDRNAAFTRQHADAMAAAPAQVASLVDGLKVLDLIAAIEKASEERSWVDIT